MAIKFFKKACLLIPVTGPLRKAVSEAAQSTHRAGKDVRIELDPHITLRYGIQDESPETLRTIRKILMKTESFGIQLGEIKTFPASEHSEGQYPLIIRCETSEPLTKLFKEVSRKVPCDPFSFDTYSPHITLAYLPTSRIPVPTTEATRGLQGLFFPVFRADFCFKDGRRLPFPIGTALERLDSPYSAFTAPNRGTGPIPVGEGLETAPIANECYHALVEKGDGLYLLHYDKPLSHAQHYLGWAKDHEKRAAAHAAGKSGAALPAAFHKAGSKPTVVRIWKGKDRNFERKLKNQNNGRRLCPVCNPKSHATHGLESL